MQVGEPGSHNPARRATGVSARFQKTCVLLEISGTESGNVCVGHRSKIYRRTAY
jgi:hypothetical protein